MHVGRHRLGARPVEIDQHDLAHARPQCRRHRRRGTDRTDAYDAEFHTVLPPPSMSCGRLLCKKGILA